VKNFFLVGWRDEGEGGAVVDLGGLGGWVSGWGFGERRVVFWRT